MLRSYQLAHKSACCACHVSDPGNCNMCPWLIINANVLLRIDLTPAPPDIHELDIDHEVACSTLELAVIIVRLSLGQMDKYGLTQVAGSRRLC
jgi:hypothetical protein